MTCIDRETAAAYLSGDLEPSEADRWAAHVADCPACRTLVAEVADLIDSVRRDLLLLDVSSLEGDPPPLDVFIARAAGSRWAGPRSMVKVPFRADRTGTQVSSRSRFNHIFSPSSTRRPAERPRRGWLSRVWRQHAVSAAVIVIVGAGLLFWMRGTSVSAAGLLHEASAAEDASSRAPDSVMHRTVTIEERRLGMGSDVLLSRHRVEIWRTAPTMGIVEVRRVFDDRNELIAGEWTQATGLRTIYRSGVRPSTEAAVVSPPPSVPALDSPWRLEPSAKIFSGLIGDPASATLETKGSTYLIHATLVEAPQGLSTRDRLPGTASAPPSAFTLLKASLTLARSDLHVLEQTLIVRQASEIREYRFVESGATSVPLHIVSPEVFRPEPQLLGPAVLSATEPRRPSIKSEAPRRLSAAALVGLEVETLRLLDSAGALVGEQWELMRTPDAKLRVTAVVDTDARKAKLLETLAPVIDAAAVRADVQTNAEAIQRQLHAPPVPLTLREVEIQKGRIPAYADLHAYLVDRTERIGSPISEDVVDEETYQLAKRVASLARQALLEAGLLKRLVGRYSTTELQLMSPKAFEAWQSMIRSHARMLQRKTEALQRELQPIFFSPVPANDSIGERFDDLDLATAVNRAFELASAHDQIVDAAVTLSAGGSNEQAIRTPQFWLSLTRAVALAMRIQQEP